VPLSLQEQPPCIKGQCTQPGQFILPVLGHVVASSEWMLLVRARGRGRPES
jgi:hypothetical protein